MAKKKKRKMLKPDTIARTMNALYGAAQNEKYPLRTKAYYMAMALQWALGGCTWTLLSILNEEIDNLIEARGVGLFVEEKL